MKKVVRTKKKNIGNIFFGLFLAVVVTAFCKMDASAAVSAAPSNVQQVKDTSMSGVQVSWKAGRSNIGKEIKYYWQLSRSKNFSTVLAYGKSVSFTTISTDGLGGGMEFYFRVGAYESGANEADGIPEGIKWSETKTLVTPPACTTHGVKQTAASANTVKVTWKAAVGANGYEVVYYPLDNASSVSSKRTTSTSVTLTGLKQGRSYEVVVHPAKVNGSFWAVSENGGSIDVSTTYGSVTGFQNTRLVKNSASFTWNSQLTGISKPDAYRIDVTSCNDAKFKKSLFSYATLDWSDQRAVYSHKLKPGSFYLSRISSGVALADGRYAYGKASSVIAIGTTPTKISAKQSGSGIKASWSKVSGATGYEIYLSYQGSANYKKVATVNAKKTSYTCKKYNKKALKNGSYSVKVIPVRKQGSKTFRAYEAPGSNYAYAWYTKKK